MDTVYSTKKYFQSLGSDYYRSPSATRQMGTDYTSYRGDTVGRRSTLGPSYTHMSKYSYATDHSVYGGASQYNGGWGLWRDTGNLTPTTMSSTKNKRSLKSFSIILMTAAFIVVLAVLSVAGLAFYFSTFRNEMDNSALAFNGHFHVLRGDVFTTGLKYNHTAVFRQKRSYYVKLITTALQERGGMPVTRCEIDSFGSGPLVQVQFRVLLDMKSMPMTSTNVEEQIKQALLQEVTSLGSPFKNIKIDQDTMDVKRLLDHDMLRAASFIREIDHQTHEEHSSPPLLMTSPKSSSSGEAVSKKSGVIEKTIHKFSATTSQMAAGQNTKANTPTPSVIKGSFEITKTEADIAQKKDTPPAYFHTTPGAKATTAKVKMGGGKFGNVPGAGTAGAAARPNLGKIDKIEKVNSTVASVEQQQEVEASSTTSSTTTTTTTMTPSTSTANVAISTSLSPSHQQEQEHQEQKQQDNHADNENLPQLDANLFTSAPILDSQPWHPIPVPTVVPPLDQRKPDQRKGHPATEPTPPLYGNDFGEQQQQVPGPQVPQQPVGSVGLRPGGAVEQETDEAKRKKLMETVTRAPSRPIYYQSFTNPTFSLTTLGIERLGAADVRPYPLPVNKLYNVDQQQQQTEYQEGLLTSPLDTGMHLHEGEIMNGGQVATADEAAGYDERFEHLGGGVSAKKPDYHHHQQQQEKGTPVETTTTSSTGTVGGSSTATLEDSRPPPTGQEDPQLGDILFDLLELNDQQQQRHKYLEEEVTALPSGDQEEEGGAPVAEEATTKLSFINIREHILNKNKVATPETTTKTWSEVGEQTLISSSTSTGSKLNTPEPPQTLMTTVTPSDAPGDKTSNLAATDAPAASPAASAGDSNQNWDGPALFPMHTTWELINGTVTDPKPDQTHLRRVYNDTLQAWIVENAEDEKLSAVQQASYQHRVNSSLSLNVGKPAIQGGPSSSKKQEATIQNISVIFDTLASKLGITPDVSSKSPPFANKVRNRPTPTPTAPVMEKTKIVTTPRPSPPSTSTPTTTTSTTTSKATTTIQPEIVTISRSEEGETVEAEYEEYEEEEEVPTTTTTTTTSTTTTTTKKPRRKTTTKRKFSTTTTSKPLRSGSDESRRAESSSRSPVTTTRRPSTTTTTTTRRPTTTTTTTLPPVTTVAPPVTESVVPPIFQLDPTGDDDVVPILISEPAATAGGEFEMSSEAASIGMAEVEVVADPETLYAEMLRKQATTKPPPLVTLLPVRSNSGIRTFRTPIQGRRQGEIETRRAFSRLPAVPPPATIVRTSMRVGT